MRMDYCILAIGHDGPCLYAAVLSNGSMCNNVNGLADYPCSECGTRGVHYCPADVARGDE